MLRNKSLFSVLALFVMLSMLLAACGGAAPDVETARNAAEARKGAARRAISYGLRAACLPPRARVLGARRDHL